MSWGDRSTLFLCVLATSIATVFLSFLPVSARHLTKSELRARQLEVADRLQVPLFEPAASAGKIEDITFSSPKASEFLVDGSSIPEVNFDVGPSWAGLLPISGDISETRKLFFWYFPPGPVGHGGDLIIWLNGGPGCSSLEGLLQENGPFSWSYGQAKPTKNEFSWTNLSHVLWVEQPVGTGFSQGKPNIRNEVDLAGQFVGFLQQFLDVFPQLNGKKLYITGESYAGTYVPYIADYIYNNPGKLDLDLQGIWLSDPSLSWNVVQQQIYAVDFVHKYKHVFAFNRTFMAELDDIAKRCNYAGYFEKYVTYPPQGLLPLPGKSTTYDKGCDVQDLIFDAALLVNPAFNIYRIFDTWPVFWDVLGFPGSFNITQEFIYFNRTDVKEAIHAPDVPWAECADFLGRYVFPKETGDESLPPAFTVLPNVIEKSVRTVIVHGLIDFILIAEGTRIAIQNMTWDGKQGFQEPIADESFIVDGMGVLGNTHTERKLTYVEVALSGHMVPQFSPKAAFQTMQYLMGYRDKP